MHLLFTLLSAGVIVALGTGCESQNAASAQLSAAGDSAPPGSGGRWLGDDLVPSPHPRGAGTLTLVEAASSRSGEPQCNTVQPCTLRLAKEEFMTLQMLVLREEEPVDGALILFGVKGQDASLAALSTLSAYSDPDGLVSVEVGAAAWPAEFTLYATSNDASFGELEVQVIATVNGRIPLSVTASSTPPPARWRAALFQELQTQDNACTNRYALVDGVTPFWESVDLGANDTARFLALNSELEDVEDTWVVLIRGFDNQGEMISWGCVDNLPLPLDEETELEIALTPREPRFSGTWNLALDFDPADSFAGPLSAGVMPWLNALSSPALPLLTLACDPIDPIICDLLRTSDGVLTDLGMHTFERLQANAMATLNPQTLTALQSGVSTLSHWVGSLSIESSLLIDSELPMVKDAVSGLNRMRWREAETQMQGVVCGAEEEVCPESGAFLAAYSEATIQGPINMYTSESSSIHIGHTVLTGHWGVVIDAVSQASLLPLLVESPFIANHRDFIAGVLGGPSCLTSDSEDDCCQSFLAAAAEEFTLDTTSQAALIDACHTMLTDGSAWLTRLVQGETAECGLELASVGQCQWVVAEDNWQAESFGEGPSPCKATLTLACPTAEHSLDVMWRATRTN